MIDSLGIPPYGVFTVCGHALFEKCQAKSKSMLILDASDQEKTGTHKLSFQRSPITVLFLFGVPADAQDLQLTLSQ